MSSNERFETVCIHGGQEVDEATGSRVVPIYQTSSYMLRDTERAVRLFELKEEGHIYSRISNPTTDVLEKRVALLEGGTAAVAVASGQAAATTVFFTIAKAGDEIVSSSKLYGGTHNLLNVTLRRVGIDTVFVGAPTAEAIKAALTERTRAVLVETIANPGGEVPDLPAIAEVAHDHGVPLVVDSTCATPYLSRPLTLGADIVFHSATKFLGGHGTSLGGVVVDGGSFPWDNGRFPEFTEPSPGYHGLRYWEAFGSGSDAGNVAFAVKARAETLRDLGPALSPFNSFLFLLGLETLPLRMARHCENAMALASFLENHPAVSWVSYPGLPGHPSHGIARNVLENGFGAILSFGVRGGAGAARRTVERVSLISFLANIGDVRTLIIHPASTTHQQLSAEERVEAGAPDDLVRLSVGLEHGDDLVADLQQALEGA